MAITLALVALITVAFGATPQRAHASMIDDLLGQIFGPGPGPGGNGEPPITLPIETTVPPTTTPLDTTTTEPDTTTTAPPDTTTSPPTTNTTTPTTTAPPTTTGTTATPGSTSGGGTPGPTAGPPPSGGGGGGGGGSAAVSSAGGVFGRIASFLAPSRAQRNALGVAAAKTAKPAAKKNARTNTKKSAVKATTGTRTANAAQNVQLADTTRADTHDGGMPKMLRLLLILFAAMALIGVLLTPRPPALFGRRSGEDKGIPRRRRRRPVVTAPASRRD